MKQIGCFGLLLILSQGVLGQTGKPSLRKFDWPQWQGPQRTALSQETGLLKSWPKEGPPLQWKATGLGVGFSGPAIAAGRVYTMGNRGPGEYIICLSEKDGKVLWATPVGPVRSTGGGYPGPRCTPTVDGSLVYALGLNGDLLCVTADKGRVIWRRDLVRELGGRPGGWGYSESPLVDGAKVLVTPGGRKATIVALNKKNGYPLWACVVPEGDSAAYSSIIAANVFGQRQYFQFLGRGVVGVSATGRFLWRYNQPANGTANISTPIFHDNHVFAASAYGRGGGLVKLVKKGTGVAAEEVYFTDHMQNHHGGMILLDGYLYGANGGQLACLDFATGQATWQSGKAGKGSLGYADGCLYYRQEGGPILLVEANPKQYVELGRFQQPNRSRSPAWAHPVIANGKMYIADQDILLCYNVKQP